MKHEVSRTIFEIIPGEVLAVCRALQREGGRVYLVGGAVRDVLLGREPADWDLGTDLVPAKVLTVFPSAETDGVEFGRVRIGGVDVVSLRAEGEYEDRRHPSSVRLGVDIEEDLARRDFTINAMAVDLATCELVDPFDGRGDLARRVIRTVGDAGARFSEDPLRILRAFRLKAELGFNLCGDTLEQARRLRALLSTVSGQRCFSELQRLLLAPGAGSVLSEICQLEIFQVILPEIFDRRGGEDDVGFDCEKTAGTVAFCPLRLAVRLAAMFRLAPRGAWEEASRRFGVSSRLTAHVRFLIAGSGAFTGGDPAYTVRKIVKTEGEEKLRDLLALEVARSLAERQDPASPVVLQLMAGLYLNAKHRPDSYTKLCVSGLDLTRELGIGEGPKLGELIRYLEEAVLRDPECNDRESLLKMARSWTEKRLAVETETDIDEKRTR